MPDGGWPSAAEADASRLFSPLLLKSGLSLSARTWVPAMVPWRASLDGEVNADVLDWYERFAQGEPGVLVVEATGVRDTASGPLLRIHEDRFIPGLTRLVNRVREASGGRTKLFIQIIDFLGVKRRPERAVWYRRFLRPASRHRAALERLGKVAPTNDDELREALLQLDESLETEVLSQRELEDLRFGARERITDEDRPAISALPQILPTAFASAAARAKAAGFDGVELHYAHAYTMASFLSRTNTRKDGYGSSLTGRLRLPLEVLEAVRAKVGHDFSVGARILGDEAIEGGSTMEEVHAIALALGRAGLDFLSVSRGGKFDDARQPRVGEAVYPYTGPSGLACMPVMRMDGGPFGRNVPFAASIRQHLRQQGVNMPIVTAGGLCSFAQMEEILNQGHADCVAAARQSLADPDWWKKMRLGRGASIRRCSFTSYCEGLDQRHKQVTCRLWDRVLGGDEVTRSPDGRRLIAPPFEA
jgi:2,4-dienoyl-CoA reductase-like NADH-dependent reductase (Old Yellow Enzyme family)